MGGKEEKGVAFVTKHVCDKNNFLPPSSSHPDDLKCLFVKSCAVSHQPSEELRQFYSWWINPKTFLTIQYSNTVEFQNISDTKIPPEKLPRLLLLKISACLENTETHLQLKLLRRDPVSQHLFHSVCSYREQACGLITFNSLIGESADGVSAPHAGSYQSSPPFASISSAFFCPGAKTARRRGSRRKWDLPEQGFKSFKPYYIISEHVVIY